MKLTAIFAGCLLLEAGIFILSLCQGTIFFPPGKVAHLLIQAPSTLDSFVLWTIRLPRALATIFGGAVLAVSGLLLQVYFRNPVVGPFVLGISSGATLMVSLVMLTSISLSLPLLSPYITTAFAMLGALVVIGVVVAVSARVKHAITLLIVGLMVGYLCHSVTAILMAFAEKQQIKGFVLWQLGSFSGFKWDEIKLLTGLGTVLLLVAFTLSKPLNALLLGEDYALSMGLDIRRIRTILLFCACSMAGLITALAGPVAFIGLAVPHLARLIFSTSDNRLLIPGVMILGGLITSGCDLVARFILAPVELPLSAITAIFGAPLVISLLAKRQVKL